MPTNAELSAQLETANARIAELEEAFGLNFQDTGDVLHLPPALTKLLGCLLASPNVTADMIMMRLNIATDAKVAVHRLRGYLKPLNININSRRGLGYWLSDADKARLREITLKGSAETAPAPAVIEAVA